MKTHFRAVVVGGGAVGTSIAYHLAKGGWKDVVLLERDELTSGSTWHAAGLLPLFNMSYATTHIHQYSVEFYKTLEAETGLNAGFSVVGNLRMAQGQERMDEYMLYASTAETCGVPFEWMTPNQIKNRWPLVRTEDLVGAKYHPTDGYINPADVTMAMAKGARQRGVSIERKLQVDSYRWKGSEWEIICCKMVEKGGNLLASNEKITITSSLSDLHGAITGAIASLKGPLHGGANEAVMHMMKEIGKPEKAKAWIENALDKKKVIMGFGHRVYRTGDSRVPTMKHYMFKVAKLLKKEKYTQIYEILEKVMLEKKNIHPNVDFPCGPTYYMMGIDIDFYTPIFVMSRITGWSAHIICLLYTSPSPRHVEECRMAC